MPTFNLSVTYNQHLRTASADTRREWCEDANNVLRKIYSGAATAGSQLVLTDGATAATGTITISGAVANADTVTIGGTVFTAVASNPTNNQFLSGTAAVASADLLRAINASTTAAFKGLVSPAASGTNIVLTAAAAGPGGNLIALAKSGTNISVSGALLTGGVSNATQTWTY